MPKSFEQQSPQLSKLREKITWICQAVRWMIVAWLVWILVLVCLPLSDLQGTIDKINKSPLFADAPVNVQNLVASRSVNLFVWVVAVFIGVAAWKLMTGYLQGDIFSELAANRLKRVGQAALFTTIVNALARPLSLWLFSPTLLYNQQLFGFFVPDDLLYLLISALILSLAKVYQTAAEINAENKQFV